MADDRPGPHPNLARGRWGEGLAAEHYRRLGCEILDRNWRTATGELDLVVRDGATIVFSEVKTRRTDDFGPASAAVSAPKQQRIRRLAIEWLRAHDLRPRAIRFDVVAITGDHCTPCVMKSHSFHPIPLLVCGPFCDVDETASFDESQCLRGSIGTIHSEKLMGLLLANAGKLQKFGA